MSETKDIGSSLPSDSEPPDSRDTLVSLHSDSDLSPQNGTALYARGELNFAEQLQGSASVDIGSSSLKKIFPSCDKKNMEAWRIENQYAFKNLADLSRMFIIPESEKRELREVVKKYHMRIPNYYFSLIKNIDDPSDPIRQQCVPQAAELENNVDMMNDPLNEEGTSPVSCLVHRYPDRALLIVTSRCFMYCRHCTRKRLWDEKKPEPTLKDIEKAVEYIGQNTAIREVVMSGGDPLTMPTERIERILRSLSRIPHLQVIRIGTRAPVVFPDRIDENLCSVLKRYENLWINVQFNHPLEVAPKSIEACKKLRHCGIPISNQTVLLKGVNDSPEVMRQLCQALQQIGVRPYYLFQCDPVIGTYHFRTSVWAGVEIIEKMRGHTSGMCVPTFVVDGVDGKGKIPIGPNYVRAVKEGAVKLRNYKNETFWYDWPTNGENMKNNKQRVLSVAIVFNLKKKNIDNSLEKDTQEEYDEIETIEALKTEIERFGFNVIPIEQTPDFADVIRHQNVDFVLNLAEGIGMSRNRESQVPAILEMLGIPYSGSDPLALGITLDKFQTNQILKNAKIPVPKQYVVSKESDIDRLSNIFDDTSVFIVKPRWEGSSKGIFLNSVVDNFQDLKQRALFLLARYEQPAVVEEYLENEEITAGVCGNGETAHLAGMMKIVPRNATREKFIYSIENKRDWRAKVRYESCDTISPKTRESISDYALKAFFALELRDIARIDFRLDKNNIPNIIDVNPLPGLSPVYSDLPILYSINGKNYAELVKLILRESFKRCGLAWV